MALAQSAFIEISVTDLQEIDKRLQQFEALKKLDASKDAAIEELEKALDIATRTLELDKRELQLNDRIIAIKDQQIAAQAQAFADMKDVADRAIKLAETSKPKNSIWTTIGLVLGGIVAGLALAAAL